MNAQDPTSRRQAIDDELRSILGDDHRLAEMTTTHRQRRDQRNQQAVRNLSVKIDGARTQATRRRLTFLAIPALAACAVVLVLLPTMNDGIQAPRNDVRSVAAAAANQLTSSTTTQAGTSVTADATSQVAIEAVDLRADSKDVVFTDNDMSEAVLDDLASEHIIEQLAHDIHDADGIVPITSTDIDNLMKGI